MFVLKFKKKIKIKYGGSSKQFSIFIVIYVVIIIKEVYVTKKYEINNKIEYNMEKKCHGHLLNVEMVIKTQFGK